MNCILLDNEQNLAGLIKWSITIDGENLLIVNIPTLLKFIQKNEKLVLLVLCHYLCLRLKHLYDIF